MDNTFQGQTFIPAVDFKVIHFFDKRAPAQDGLVGREIILLYSLGQDGVIREFANQKWTPLPILSEEP
jgi:hypothetical protein